jgi:hypothetical protein
VWLETGRSVHDVIGDGYTMLRLGRSQADASGLECAMREIGAPLEILTIDAAAPRDVYGYDLILLRPDLHVAWRGNSAPENPEELAACVTGH